MGNEVVSTKKEVELLNLIEAREKTKTVSKIWERTMALRKEIMLDGEESDDDKKEKVEETCESLPWYKRYWTKFLSWFTTNICSKAKEVKEEKEEKSESSKMIRL